jgi:hypothetical protein
MSTAARYQTCSPESESDAFSGKRLCGSGHQKLLDFFLLRLFVHEIHVFRIIYVFEISQLLPEQFQIKCIME